MALFLLGFGWLLLVALLWRHAQGRATASTLHRDLLAAGILLGLILGFFWRTLSGDVFQPADGGDLVSFLFPTYRFAAQQLAQGVLPLWNPHLYGGAPFIADIQAGLLYPPNLLLFLLRPNFDYPVMQWLAIGHLYWAGLGVYVLLRTLQWPSADDAFGRTVSRPAAIFGALAFALSDPLLIHVGNLNLIAVLSWLPWVLAAYQRALRGRSLRWAALAGALFALANYAGHAQSSYYIGLALGVYTILWWLTALRTERNGGVAGAFLALRNDLGLLVSTGALTALLTAPLLLPALELTQHTSRSQFTYQDTVGFSLAPAQAIGLLTPAFFGHGPALHWGLWERVETPFAGVATLILALAALLLAVDSRRSRLWPWLGLAIFGFVVALGNYTVFHGWLTQLLPGFGQFRAPARALVLWTFGLTVIAAVGLEEICRPRGVIRPASELVFNAVLKWGALILVGIGLPLIYLALLLTQQDPTAFLRASVATLALTLAAGFWVATWALLAARRAGWLSGGAVMVLLIAVLYLDLAAAGAYTDISPTDPTSGYDHPAIVDFLQRDPEPFRIDTDTGIANLWQPDAAALYGLDDLGGVANPLTLRHWSELLAATGGRQSSRYDMLNAKYVIVADGTPLPQGKFELALDAPGELAIYRNLAALPRAWLVHSATVLENEEMVLAALQQDDFDPSVTVLLSQNGWDGSALTPASRPETVTMTAPDVNHLTLHTQASAPALLVLSEVWYPGWQATVNGVTTDVLRANHALRAIPVPAGEATVELRFAPQSWLWGRIAWLLGIVLAGLLWFWPASKPRSDK